jgi:peptide/nickel transport system permease protein
MSGTAQITSRIGNAFSVCALSALILMVCASFLAPWLAPYSETQIVGGPWTSPIWDTSSDYTGFILGTDQIGRDILSRIMFGTRNTIAIAFVTVTLAFGLGGACGFFAAISRGFLDELLSRIVDLLMAIPALIVTLMVLAIFGSSLFVLIATIAILDSTRVFRLARLLALNITSLEYFESARLRGEGALWLAWREIIPNVWAPLLAEFGIRFCYVFLFTATLSFLGLGIQPPTSDLGNMVRDNAGAITYGIMAPLFPALALAFLVLGITSGIDRFTRAMKNKYLAGSS